MRFSKATWYIEYIHLGYPIDICMQTFLLCYDFTYWETNQEAEESQSPRDNITLSFEPFLSVAPKIVREERSICAQVINDCCLVRAKEKKKSSWQ